jgi:rhomboid protease GluP
MIYLSLVVLGGFALYVMTPQERTKLFGRVLQTVRYAKDATIAVHAAHDPFHEALGARTTWAVVTPTLVIINVAVFVRMLFGDGSLSDPETQLAWGGNFGPRTTNGEWWRLVTSIFVHAGPLHLLADVAGLFLLGAMLERLVGHFAFATVYFASGVFASLGSLSADPMTVNVGASGAIFGVLGLLVATAIWGFLSRSPLTMSLAAARRLAPSVGVFLLYTAVTGGLGRAAVLNGLVMGLACGLLVAKGYGDRKTPALRSAAALASALVIASVSAFSMRGFTDVKPEIERIVAVETRTAGLYEKAVEQFRLGGITADALAQVIDRTILPELRAAHARLSALDGVPAEHRSMVSNAVEYLRLRGESWRLRAEGLHNGSMPTLQKADRTERASLDVLEGVRPSEQK